MKAHHSFITAIISLSILSSSVIAQEYLTTDDIVKSLKPKVRTRGISAPQLGEEDKQFIDKIKHTTRGITIEERDKLSDIVTTSGLPSIDLEVNFAVDSAKLEPSAIATLEKLGNALKSQELSGKTFLVAGYTDARGTADHNQHLSEQRAAAVKAYLASSYKLPQSDLVAVGYGQEKLKNTQNPLADENRRVKITNLTQ